MFNKKKIEERRKYRRLHAYHLVKYRVISAEKEGETVLASLANIGGGGICLRSEESLPVGSTVQVSINLPQFPQPVTSIARVVWTKKLKSAQMYECGLQFIEIEDMLRSKIASDVENLSKVMKDK